MRKTPKSTLTIVPSSGPPNPNDPPPNLGPAGQALWASVVEEYHMDDIGSREILRQCCAAADRAESLRQRIDTDGEVVPGRSGPKSHPLLAAELSARGLVCRLLSKLGLNLEPIKAPGRPPGWRR
jgi:hypothetical protein